MKVFIFGAGASRGSQPEGQDARVVAPLVNELFDERYQTYADQVNIPTSLMGELRSEWKASGSLEGWLTQRWDKIETLKESKSKEAERALFGKLSFYIWKLLLGVSGTYHEPSNGYYTFLRKLRGKDEPFGIISFNYDTLLERAIKDTYHLTFDSLEDYLRFQYIKPHGSINWFLQKRSNDRQVSNLEMIQNREFRYDIASLSMFSVTPISMESLQIIDPIHPDLNNHDLISSQRFNGQYFYPLVFLPLTAKAYSAVDGFYHRIIDAGKDLLSGASEIYLIGYRAADEVIKYMFGDVRAETILHIVAKEDAGKIYDSVIKWHPQIKKGRIITGGFQELIANYEM